MLPQHRLCLRGTRAHSVPGHATGPPPAPPQPPSAQVGFVCVCGDPYGRLEPSGVTALQPVRRGTVSCRYRVQGPLPNPAPWPEQPCLTRSLCPRASLHPEHACGTLPGPPLAFLCLLWPYSVPVVDKAAPACSWRHATAYGRTMEAAGGPQALPIGQLTPQSLRDGFLLLFCCFYCSLECSVGPIAASLVSPALLHLAACCRKEALFAPEGDPNGALYAYVCDLYDQFWLVLAIYVTCG